MRPCSGFYRGWRRSGVALVSKWWHDGDVPHIHVSSGELESIETRLVSHDEAVMVELGHDIEVFLSPSQAWTLFSGLEACLRKIDICTDGVRDDLLPVYAEIAEWRK